MIPQKHVSLAPLSPLRAPNGKDWLEMIHITITFSINKASVESHADV